MLAVRPAAVEPAVEVAMAVRMAVVALRAMVVRAKVVAMAAGLVVLVRPVVRTTGRT